MDRKQAPGTPRIPIEPIERTGGVSDIPPPKSDTFDPAPPAERGDGTKREGGMIGEG
jgi:hypothetical protein